jgi:hypothetical protein
VSFRRLWMTCLEVLVSRSRSSSLGMYIKVVTELDHDGELAGQLAHVDSHCDAWRGSRDHDFAVQRRWGTEQKKDARNCCRKASVRLYMAHFMTLSSPRFRARSPHVQ